VQKSDSREVYAGALYESPPRLHEEGTRARQGVLQIGVQEKQEKKGDPGKAFPSSRGLVLARILYKRHPLSSPSTTILHSLRGVVLCESKWSTRVNELD